MKKISTLLTAGLMVAGLGGSAFALGAGHAPYSTPLVQKVVCDANGDGKQANCVRDCEEEEIRQRETYHSKTDAERLGEKAACNKACGC